MSLYDMMIKNTKNEKCHLSKRKFDEFAEKESDPNIRCHYCGKFDVPTFFEPDWLDEHVCWACLIEETKDHPSIIHIEGDLSEEPPVEEIDVEELNQLIEEVTVFHRQIYNQSVKLEVLSLENESLRKSLNAFREHWYSFLMKLKKHSSMIVSTKQSEVEE